MKTKYKVITAFFIVLFFCAFYLIIFSKPFIKVMGITVTTAHEYGLSGGMTDDDIIDTAWQLYEDAKTTDDHQQLWHGEKPSGENIDDYIIISYTLKATNLSAFHAYCDYLLIKDHDDSKNFFITEWSGGVYQLRRFSTQSDEFALDVWAYKKGLSEKEINDLIHAVKIEAVFKNYSLTIDADDTEIRYVG